MPRRHFAAARVSSGERSVEDARYPDVRRVAALQERWTAAWHEGPTAPVEEEFGALVEREHRANFDLWHAEDEAREPNASDTRIAGVKQAIDHLNQRRNDLTEEIDVWMLARFGAQRESAPLHSETPGMMLDRLSILALKLFHTRLEATRSSASEDHRARNRERAMLLGQQRSDLVGCLVALLAEVTAGTRRVKLYRQMKMYNDPELNPKMYQVGTEGG